VAHSWWHGQTAHAPLFCHVSARCHARSHGPGSSRFFPVPPNALFGFFGFAIFLIQHNDGTDWELKVKGM
jgi:hypothetical protein